MKDKVFSKEMAEFICAKYEEATGYLLFDRERDEIEIILQEWVKSLDEDHTKETR